MTVAELFVGFGFNLNKGSMDGVLKSIKTVTRAAQGFILALGVSKFVGMVEGAAHAGTEILGLSKQFGISTQSVQEWSYIAKQSGSNIKELGVGISQLERNMRAVHQGGGGKLAQRALREFGITGQDIAAGLSSPDGLNNVMFKIADHVKKFGNNAETASAINVLFGRRARGVAADLAGGSDQLKAQIQHLKDMGGVIADDKLQNLKKLDNNIQDLKTSFSALFTNVIGTMAPILIDMLQGALKWFQENREEIAGALTTAVNILAKVFKALGKAISFVFGLFKAAADGDDGAIAVLAAIAAIILSVVVPALAAMAVAAWASIGPYALIAAAVALVAYGILKLIKYGPQIREALGEAADWVVAKWHGFIDWLEALPGRAADLAEEAGNWIMDKLGAAAGWVKDKFHDMWEDIKHYGSFGIYTRHFASEVHAEEKAKAAADKTARAAPHSMTDGEAAYWKAHSSATAPGATAAGATATTSATTQHITIGDINIHGVKDAASITSKLTDSLADQMRHFTAATAGEVQ